MATVCACGHKFRLSLEAPTSIASETDQSIDPVFAELLRNVAAVPWLRFPVWKLPAGRLLRR